jgi:hypothetical protein
MGEKQLPKPEPTTVEEAAMTYLKAGVAFEEAKRREEQERLNRPMTHQEYMNLKTDVGQVASHLKKTDEWLIEAINGNSKVINTNSEAFIKMFKLLEDKLDTMKLDNAEKAMETLGKAKAQLDKCWLVLGCSVGLAALPFLVLVLAFLVR